jgi:hypothetical protein
MDLFIVSLFFFVLGIFYASSIIFRFFVSLRAETPTPMNLSKIEKICFLFSISYVVTLIISFIIN